MTSMRCFLGRGMELRFDGETGRVAMGEEMIDNEEKEMRWLGGGRSYRGFCCARRNSPLTCRR